MRERKDKREPQTAEHRMTHFAYCAFGDGGFYYHDGADRAVCSCGWKSAASTDKKALVALWDIHQRDAREAGDVVIEATIVLGAIGVTAILFWFAWRMWHLYHGWLF